MREFSNLTTFKTKADVVEYLQAQDELVELRNGNFTYKGIYELRHGESDKPEFKPTRYKDGWGIKKIHFYYPSTFNAPKDGRCAKLDEQSLEYVLLERL